MFDYNAIKNDVINYLGQYADDFDIDEVVDALRTYAYGTDDDYTTIDDFSDSVFDDALAMGENK